MKGRPAPAYCLHLTCAFDACICLSLQSTSAAASARRSTAQRWLLRKFEIVPRNSPQPLPAPTAARFAKRAGPSRPLHTRLHSTLACWSRLHRTLAEFASTETLLSRTSRWGNSQDLLSTVAAALKAPCHFLSGGCIRDLGACGACGACASLLLCAEAVCRPSFAGFVPRMLIAANGILTSVFLAGVAFPLTGRNGPPHLEWGPA